MIFCDCAAETVLLEPCPPRPTSRRAGLPSLAASCAAGPLDPAFAALPLELLLPLEELDPLEDPLLDEPLLDELLLDELLPEELDAACGLAAATVGSEEALLLPLHAARTKHSRTGVASRRFIDNS